MSRSRWAASDYSSRVRASGYYVGPTGVYFEANTAGANDSDVGLNSDASPYAGGNQLYTLNQIELTLELRLPQTLI